MTGSEMRIGYIEPFDGIRGLSLLAVLLFHSGFGWASGGFLGVSTFFTLSGFLIGSLLLQEWCATGRVDLLAFWARRVRRLVPASLVTLLALAGTVRFWLPGDRLEGLASDVLAALTYVSNWRFVGEEYAYSLIFSDPSPTQHFWSVAIDGQFYLLFPPLALLALRLGGLRGFGASERWRAALPSPRPGSDPAPGSPSFGPTTAPIRERASCWSGSCSRRSFEPTSGLDCVPMAAPRYGPSGSPRWRRSPWPGASSRSSRDRSTRVG